MLKTLTELYCVTLLEFYYIPVQRIMLYDFILKKLC